MVLAYQAATVLEAHMVANLLHQHGIVSAWIEGEYLQGGVGLLYLGLELKRAEYDRNLDGRIDMIDDYTVRGLADKSRVDADFDGEFETRMRYHNDLVLRVESDTDQNGSIDLVDDCEHGELRTTTIRNAPGTAMVTGLLKPGSMMIFWSSRYGIRRSYRGVRTRISDPAYSSVRRCLPLSSCLRSRPRNW